MTCVLTSQVSSDGSHNSDLAEFAGVTMERTQGGNLGFRLVRVYISSPSLRFSFSSCLFLL